MTTFAIVGSRYWTDYAAFCKIVDAHIPEGVTRIVSGGARTIKGRPSGVDTMAEWYARDKGLAMLAFPPVLGFPPVNTLAFKLAAHLRNQRIVDAADAGLALPGPRSRGTYDTIRRAMASPNAARWTVVKVPE